MFKKLSLIPSTVALSASLLLGVNAVQADGESDKSFEPTIFPVTDPASYTVSKPFSDVPATSNYYKSIHILRDLAIINGYNDEQFKSQNNITRKQAALLINRLAENDYIKLSFIQEPKSLNDLNAWYEQEAYRALANLYRAGLLEMDAAGNISPNEPLTRGEMAKILVMAFQLDPSTKTNSFTDIKNKDTARYAETLLERGITTGYDDGTFKPQAPLSRAHYAQFIFRTLDHKTSDVTTSVDTSGTDNFSTSIQERWAPTVKSFMFTPDADTYVTIDVKDQKIVDNGTYTTNESIPTEVTVQTFSRDYKPLNTEKLAFELPIFGTFYEGEDHYYIAYGQDNKEQDDDKEVIRIVKYDRDFNRVDALSVKGGDIGTVDPFSHTASRMAEQDGQLVLHTSRLRYMSSDGLNHQSQLTLVIDTNKMQVVNDTSLSQKNHVSHSFNQFVLFDGDDHVLLDHGDAYPRSLVIHKGDGFTYEEKEIVPIPGDMGANQTGVSIGGFEQSNSHYVMLYNEINHSKAQSYGSFQIEGANVHSRDINIATISKNLANVETHKIASYTDSTQHRASLPTLVKISDDEFVVMWQEFTYLEELDSEVQNFAPTALKYVKVNSQGELLSDVQSKENIYSSYMQPIYADGNISWFVNQNDKKYFYALDVADL